MAQQRIVGRIGDVDPIEYGGGIIRSDGHGGHDVEYVHGLEDDYENDGVSLELYEASLEKGGAAFLGWYDWVDWEAVAGSAGSHAEDYTAGALRSAASRARALQDAAGHYGWYEFDQTPQTLSVSDIERRWSL